MHVGGDRDIRRCGGRLRLGHATMPPPPGCHAQNPYRYAQGKSAEHHQHLRRTPLIAKEKMNRGVLLVVKRKGKQGKKNGGFEQPFDQG